MQRHEATEMILSAEVYYADEGDFATAGAVRMDLLNEVPASATLGYGEDGYRRALLLDRFFPRGRCFMPAGFPQLACREPIEHADSGSQYILRTG